MDKKESSQLLYDLGNRHVSYGAKIEHFPIIIDALVETLSEGLGDQFTDEVKIAWGKAIAYLKFHMSMGLENTD